MVVINLDTVDDDLTNLLGDGDDDNDDNEVDEDAAVDVVDEVEDEGTKITLLNFE